jgi:hypothetical protein
MSGTTPFITSVMPANGSSVTIASPISPPPILTVQFNEDMKVVDVANTNNYLIFGSTGQSLVVNSATYNNNGGVGPFVVTLGYNNNAPLSADTYTLLVRGDQLHDAVSGLPMAQAGQLVVANTTTGNVSVVGVNIPNDSQLEAASNFSAGTGGFGQPTAVALVDDGTLRGVGFSGISDLVVTNSFGFGGPVVNIFQGRAGGGFGATPALTLNLPAGAQPTGLVVGSLRGFGRRDIAVSESSTTANPGGEVTVFLSNFAFGTLSYAAAASYAVAGNPIAIAAADIDGDNKTDLVVASSNLAGVGDVTVLLGTGNGVFGAGSSTSTGAANLTGLASFGNFFKPDLVVSSSGGPNSGTYLLRNTSVSGTVTLTPFLLTGSVGSSAVAVGDINQDGLNDVVAVTTGGVLQSWSGPGFGIEKNLGSVGFVSKGAIAITNLDGINGNDIVVANGFFGNTMKVLLQTSTPGTFAAPVSYATDQAPVALAVGDTNQDGVPDVVTANEFSNDFTVFRGSVTAGVADGGFWGATNYPTAGGSPQSVVTGDLNGDGLPDMVVAKNGSNQVEVFLSTGVDAHGLTTYGPGVNYAVGTQPVSVVLGNFDGPMTIASATELGSTVTITTAAPNGFATGQTVTISGVTPSGYNGRYTIAVMSSTTFTYTAATSGMANGSGGTADLGLDIAVADQGSNDVRILLNNGTGLFGAPTIVPLGTIPTQLVVADFNKDGNADLAVSSSAGAIPGVQLLLGKGDGTFQLPKEIAAGLKATALATADFNNDGNPDLVVASSLAGTGQLSLLLGDGTGNFSTSPSYSVSANPDSIAVADLNRDGFPDVVVSSGTTPTSANLSVLLNSLGHGFDPALPVTLFAGAQLQSVAVTDVNSDPFPDLVVSLKVADAQNNNLYALLGKGDGTFQTPVPYFTGSNAAPSFVTVASDPLITASSFTVLTSNVTANLIRNGTFEVPDLNGDPGSLTGWHTFAQDNSAGQWEVQTPNVAVGTSTSPLSQTPVPAPPQGSFAAMLDQANFSLPSQGFGQVFAGTHLLYQDIAIPANDPLKPTTATLSFSLYFNSSAAFSDPNATPALDYTNTQVPNQQIRVDIMDPAASPIDVGSGVLQNLFITTPSTPTVQPYTVPMAIASATKSGNTITITTTAPNGFANGQVVTISGVSTPGYNGRYTITVVNSTTFTYTVATGSMTIASATESGSTVTITTTAPNGFANNQAVTISGVTPPGYNGTYNITVVNPTTFTYTDATTGLTPATGSPGTADWGPGNGGTADPNSFDLSAFAGRTVRLRIAETNNQGKLLIGLDSVRLATSFIDTVNPTLSNAALRNPGFGATAGFAGFTTDPTIIGHVDDNGTSNNVAFVTAVTANTADSSLILTATESGSTVTIMTSTPPAFTVGQQVGISGVSVAGYNGVVTITGVAGSTFTYTAPTGLANGAGGIAIAGGIAAASNTTSRTKTWDALGNFTLALPIANPGSYNVSVQVTDRAGLVTTSSLTFNLQGPSVTNWAAKGPGPIATATAGVNYPTVSGRITGISLDPRDSSGNTFYVGSANGGVWKTTDGGHDYTPLTDGVVDGSGKPVNIPIGGLALDPANPNIIYAGTGVGDAAAASYAGSGILKSVNGGVTWTLVGASVFNGARITKVAITGATSLEPERVYVAVASGGSSGPGLYRTEDGGVTWMNVLQPNSNMFTSPNPPGTLLGAVPLGSVTDLVINPFNPEKIYVGIGNIGLLTSSVSAGVWISPNHGGSWQQLAQGINSGGVPNDNLPSGLGVGRVTIGLGSGRLADSAFVYVLMANASPFPLSPPPNSLNTGTYMGLFASRNGGNDWTKVMLRQPDLPTGPPSNLAYRDLDLMNKDGGYVGALAVDPTDPYVVFVGGSRRLAPTNVINGADLYMHALLRVDTQGMRDHQTPVFGQGIPNDGDDLVTESIAFDNVNNGNFPAIPPGFQYTNGPYSPVGMPWVDLENNISNDFVFSFFNALPTTIPNRLPSTIHSLVVDPQGRLLIGTDGGLWRSNSVGFADARPNDQLDATGLTRNTLPIQESNLTLTALNGNLQIADLNSVAVDPNNRNIFYTGQAGTGFAETAGPLTWQSMGLFSANLISPNLVIPVQGDGGTVRVAPPAPGSAPGTPSRVYTTWQYADFSNGLGVQASSAGGASGSFLSINNGLQTADQASLILPIVVNPNKDSSSGTPQDELLYGTNRVYESDNSGNQWDLFPRTFTAAEGRISALAFAPSGIDAFYVGTDQGQVFVDLSDGGASFPNMSVGLPGTAASPVNGIAVYPGDPTANTMVTLTGALAGTYQRQQIAFVMLGGTGTGAGHVFRTLNAGVTWTNVTTSLPDVPAYTMAISDKPQLGGTPGEGALYVATQAGVYVSLDFGATWKTLGKGLPNAPVVDLQYNSALNILAAGTHGRGVFSIDTSPFSFLSDQVVNENTPSHVLPFTVNDPTGTASFNITTSVSGDTALIGNITLGGSGVNRTIQFTPGLNKFSTAPADVAIITVTIMSSGGFSYQQSFKVTVNFVNQLPTISTIGTQVMLKNQTLAVPFTIADVETPASMLVVSASSSNTALVPNLPANLALSGSGANRTLTITPLANQVGSTNITISVTDTMGGVGTETFNLLVNTKVTLPFSDDFNRPDSVNLGPSWNSNSGNIGVKANQLSAPAAAGIAIVSLNQLSVPDVALQSDIVVGANQDLGLIARYNGGMSNMYLGLLFNRGGVNDAEIWKNVGGTWTMLANHNVGSGTGALRFEVTSDSLKLFYGPTGSLPSALTLVTFANDSSLTAPGSAGYWTSGGGVTADNFKAISLTPAPLPMAPFTDTFTQPAGTQLSTNWVNQGGNFSSNGSAIVANANTAVSLATIYGLPLALANGFNNGSAQADINLVGSPAQAQADVIARYSASGYYMGYVLHSGSSFLAGIYRYTAGASPALVEITAGPVSVPSGAGTLRLVVAGTSLKLYYGPTTGSPPTTLVNFATDSAFAIGTTGIRASAGMTLDNFRTANPAPAAVSSVTANPSSGDFYGQTVTFTATVTGGVPNAANNVQFVDTTTGTSLGFGSTVSGTATLTTTATALNANINPGHTITATYTDSAGNFASSSNSLTGYKVAQATTAVVVSNGSPSPSDYGQAATFTATLNVTSPGTPITAATINGAQMLLFTDNYVFIGFATVPTSSTTTSIVYSVTTTTPTTLGAGTHAIYAVWASPEFVNSSPHDLNLGNVRTGISPG